MKNNQRFDLSDYLIHFFRDIDLDSVNAPLITPEFMGWQNINEGDFYPAFFMLRSAINNGRLWATWSIRNEKRTIYGNYPAICFTEMPIAAFLEAGIYRQSQGQAMSPYAIIFKKSDLYKLGVRQVIYDSYPESTDKKYGVRMLDERYLPADQQYRYVQHVISDGKVIDWTHEREWRLICKENIENYKKVMAFYEEDNDDLDDNNFYDITDWDQIPGLDLDNNHISGFGVIVKSSQQAELISHDILTRIDKGLAKSYHNFFVLVYDILPSLESLQNPDSISTAIKDASIFFDVFFQMPKQKSEVYTKQFLDLKEKIFSNNNKKIFPIESGSCWLWLHDNKHYMTRALLDNGCAFVSNSGRYLVPLFETSPLKNLREQEYLTEIFATAVYNDFNLPCSFFSVSNSLNPDDVPFRSDHIKRDNHSNYFNYSYVNYE